MRSARDDLLECAFCRDRLPSLVVEDGFTLIEVLVVLTIIALAAAIAAPRFDFLKGALMRRDAAGLLSDLKTLREDAMYSGTQTSLRLTRGGYLIEPARVARALWGGEAVSIDARPRWDGGESKDIVFFPDGSSTGGEVTLGDATRKIVFTVDPLTAYAEKQ